MNNSCTNRPGEAQAKTREQVSGTDPQVQSTFTFMAHCSRVPVLASAHLWAVEGWSERDSELYEEHTEVTVTFRSGALSREELCWVIANVPGCTDAAMTVDRTTSFTGQPVCDSSDLGRRSESFILLRCMDGVVSFLKLMKVERAGAEVATALFQFGVDANEASERGYNEEVANLVMRATRLRNRVSA